MKNTKKSLLMSITSTIVSVAMLVGTTFAYFTDSVTSGSNRIVAGNLDVDLVMYNKTQSKYVSIGGDDGDIFSEANNGNGVNWEPGKTEIVYLGVRNLGSLALKYNILLRVTDGGLIGSLEYALIDGVDYTTASGLGLTTWAQLTATAGVVVNNLEAGVMTVAEDGCLDEIVNGTQNETDYFALAVHMKETAGNEYMSKPGAEKYVEVDVTVNATQYNAESDSFGKDYDKDAYDTCLMKGHSYTFNSETGECSCQNCDETFDGSYFAVLDNALNPIRVYSLTSSSSKELATYGVTFSGDRISYTNKGYGRNVAFRTTGGDLVIDAPNDTVYRYGKVENVYLLQVADHSYYEYGIVGDLVVVNSGHIVINATAKVTDLSTAKEADAKNIVITIEPGSEVDTIAVYKAQENAAQINNESAASSGVENLVIIPDKKLARIGQVLYDSLVTAMANAGVGEAVRLVNDEVTSAETKVEDVTLKVSFDVNLSVAGENDLTIVSTGIIENCGTINTTGITSNSGKIVNNGSIINNGNTEEKVLVNDNIIYNYGLIEASGDTSFKNNNTFINLGVMMGDYTNEENATEYKEGDSHTHNLVEYPACGTDCKYYQCSICQKYFAADKTTEITKGDWSHNIVNGECTLCKAKIEIGVYNNGAVESYLTLAAFRDSVNNGTTYEGKTVKLLGNVSLNTIENGEFKTNSSWISIGKANVGGYQSVAPFKGIFDGQGYTISGIYHHCYDNSDLDTDHTGGDPGPFGLFGCVENATIKNLTIDHIFLGTEEGNGYNGNFGVGAFAGVGLGNCNFTNLTLKNATLCGYNCALGGIVGCVSQGNFVFDGINADASNELTTWNWGEWSACDTAMGGIVGVVDVQHSNTGRKTSYVTIKNSTIAVKIMQMNDVMSNYAWYEYRSSGMVVGGFTFDHADYCWNNTDDISDVDLATTLLCNNVDVIYDMWNHQYYCTAGTHIEGKPYSGDHLGRNDGEHFEGCNGDQCLVFDQLIGGWTGGTWRYDLPEPYKALTGVTVTYLNDSKPIE